ncbi:MAG TPA: DUF2917 domain-containing protein [Usitatibacter sp.]|jgi:hypothetical protein|nr:DUF2917 domain-containing protein [Usitatibacter sp.]
MTLNLEYPTLALGAGQVMSLDDAAGTAICARAGTVWVTYEGNVHDFILAPGECLVLERDGRTVLQALEPAFVSIQ